MWYPDLTLMKYPSDCSRYVWAVNLSLSGATAVQTCSLTQSYFFMACWVVIISTPSGLHAEQWLKELSMNMMVPERDSSSVVTPTLCIVPLNSFPELPRSSMTGPSRVPVAYFVRSTSSPYAAFFPRAFFTLSSLCADMNRILRIRSS